MHHQSALAKRKSEKELTQMEAMSSLAEVSGKIICALELDQLADLIVKVAAKETKAQRCSLMLLEKDGRTLTIKAAVGLPQGIVETAREVVGEGIAGHVAQTGEPVVINERGEIEPWIQQAMKKTGMAFSVSMALLAEAKAVTALTLDRTRFGGKKSVLASLPLVAEDRVVGVLNLSRDIKGSPFTPSEVTFLSILCSQAAIAVRNAQLVEDLHSLQLSSVKALVAAVEAKDPYTSGHSEKVTELAIAIAEKMGLSDEEIEDLQAAGLLHDIGKIGVPDSVLNKPARLTSAEMAMVEAHPVISAQIVGKIEALEGNIPIIRHHHERYDGTGYPDGLKGDEIPLMARILSVADGFEAMTSDRPYRAAMSEEEALGILQEGAGKQWDAKIVKVFCRILNQGSVDDGK